MDKQNVVLITGMSGAGKTTAIGILEDMGYHCIDHFPVQLLTGLEDFMQQKEDPRYMNLAFATSAQDYPKFLNHFENIDANVQVIFLDASNEKLLLRYKFTRRHHPMILSSKANTLEEAIEVERDMFENLNHHNVIRIDTTKLTQAELKAALMAKLQMESNDVFSISFVSFGFKYGVPLDVDLVFDMRFLPNPYYIEEMRELTGNDPLVYDYVMNFDCTQKLLKQLVSYLDFTFDAYEKENKSHITIGIGCTGGHHRSVSVTNWLYQHYKNMYHCYKSHRDIVGKS